jgi:DNA polymerase-3 subunit epsilon/oligoribonuclease
MLGIFLDTETNGLNPQTHRVLEIAYKILDLGTGEIRESYEAAVQQSEEDWGRSDPNSLKVNGFTWDRVEGGISPKQVEKDILESFQRWQIRRKEAVFICQNPSFDRVFFSQLIPVELQEQFRWPYHWLDLASMHWAVALERAKQRSGSLLPWEIGFSKDQIASYYRLPEEAKPHRAINGVEHLILCYQAVVGFPKELLLQ